MDETLAHAAVDVSGRPFSVHTGEPESIVGFIVGNNYPVVLNRHVFDSLAFHARIALHVRVIYGRDPHHICEAQYKAIARALREAVEPDPRVRRHPVDQGRAVSQIVPILLIGLGGFLIGGVAGACGRSSVPAAVLSGSSPPACIVGGVLWLVGVIGVCVMTGVVVLDYGSGNLASAERALRRTGASVEVTVGFRRPR